MICTRSPTLSSSTGTLPRSVLIRVPAAKHGTTWSTSPPPIAVIASAALANSTNPSVAPPAITDTTEPLG